MDNTIRKYNFYWKADGMISLV